MRSAKEKSRETNRDHDFGFALHHIAHYHHLHAGVQAVSSSRQNRTHLFAAERRYCVSHHHDFIPRLIQQKHLSIHQLSPRSHRFNNKHDPSVQKAHFIFPIFIL